MDATLQKTGIRLFTGDYCPFCSRVRKELERLGLDYEGVDADADMREEGIRLSGQRAIPILTIGEESPGFTHRVEDEVPDLDNGSFSPLFEWAPYTGWTDVTADDLAQKTSEAGHESAGERRVVVDFVVFERGHE